MRGFRLRAAKLPCGASHFGLVVARGILFFLPFFIKSKDTIGPKKKLGE
jgi:hypothetical protein